MLLALWVWPRRIAALFMALSIVDLAADVTISLLLGGFYDSGLQVTWSLVSVVPAPLPPSPVPSFPPVLLLDVHF